MGYIQLLTSRRLAFNASSFPLFTASPVSALTRPSISSITFRRIRFAPDPSIAFSNKSTPSQHTIEMAATTGKAHLTAMDDVKGDGSFVRKESVFRDWISDEPDSKFKPESGRYRLFVSYACPWACRVLSVRALKGLQEAIPITVVHHHMDSGGWRFVTEQDEVPGAQPEPLFGYQRIKEFYLKADPQYNGRFTVPVLWDTRHNTVVNNESSELIVMLNNLFNNGVAKHPEIDLYPEQLRIEIDAVADSFYNSVNNGVYRCGFARKQDAYDIAVTELFDSLDKLEIHLSKNRYLVGNQLTIADIRLFVTLIRFDAVYVCHFKTNKKKIAEYPALRAFTAELYSVPEIKSTVNFEHIKKHYFCSHPTINPFGLVPVGPDLAYLDEPHGRDNM